MPSLPIAFSSRISTSTPSLASSLGLARGIGASRRLRVAEPDRQLQAVVRLILRVRFLGLVFLEFVAPQPKAEREFRSVSCVPFALRRLEQHARRVRLAEFARDESAERGEVDRLAVLARRRAHDQQPLGGEPHRADQLHGAHRLGLERQGLGGRAERLRRASQRRRGARAGLQRGADKNDQRALIGRSDGRKIDIERIGHEGEVSKVEVG
jgi:hypothetical protein